MARPLAWSPEAIEDLEAIAAESVTEFPELGRAVPEIGASSIRERFVHSYRIIYRIENERILIAAVVHGSRLLQPFLQRMGNEKKPGP